MLAYFGQHLTFPLLNCVEQLDAVQLKSLLKPLHEQLLKDQLTLLQDYAVKSKWEKIYLSGELEQKLYHLMCQGSAECLQCQCVREYGFPGPNCVKGSRASNLTHIPDDVLVSATTR